VIFFHFPDMAAMLMKGIAAFPVNMWMHYAMNWKTLKND
jgi:hypothetical protein